MTTLHPLSGPIILTRAEALVIEGLLMYTAGAYLLPLAATSPEGVETEIRRLRLECAIRDGGRWWCRERTCPDRLDMDEEFRGGACPDTFTLPAEAAGALAELLPIAFGDTLDDDIETVLGVAARLGVELQQVEAN